MAETNIRSVNGVKNALFSFCVSIAMYIFTFVGRTFFVHYLAKEYLGLNGLFSSILSFLALSELGIGNAMSYALYKPIKEDDTEKIISIMRLYKKLYFYVGSFVLLAGVLVTPFLEFFIKDSGSSVQNLSLYYLLYIVSSALSYFFIYKRTLIICDQKEYMLSIIMGIFRLLMVVSQIVILVVSGSFLGYLVCQCAYTLAENVFVSFLVNRRYPYILEKSDDELEEYDKKNIKKNMVAIFFHKIGGTLVFSSDNIIISKFIGLVQIGLYSNYTMIINAVDTVLGRLIVSLIPSLGNLMVDSDEKHSEEVFYRVLFINSWIFGFASTCLFCLLQPFIKLWIGKEYILSDMVVIIAVIYFYIKGMRLTVWSFKDASGVFTQDKYKPLIEGVINILVSIPLAIKYGIPGVLLGTVISTVSIAFWYEAMVFFRTVYGRGFGKYILVQLGYLLYNAILVCISYSICSIVNNDFVIGFVLKVLVCLLLPNIFYVITFGRTNNMKYVKRLAIKFIKRSETE